MDGGHGVRAPLPTLPPEYAARPIRVIASAIHTRHAEERMDCFVAFAPRNDGEHSLAISPRVCARFIVNFPPSEDQRAQGKPGAHRTRGPRATKKHAAEPQVQADHPAFPAQWFYGLYVISPGTGLFCPRHLRGNCFLRKLSASVGAPGPHDFAVRFKRARLASPSASTAARLSSVTFAKRPSDEAG